MAKRPQQKTPPTRAATAPPTGPRRRRPLTDWPRARYLYITTADSLVDIAAEIGCSADALGRRANAEGWREQREAWGNRVAADALEMTRREHLDQLRDAIATVYRLRTAVAAALARKVAREDYEPSVRDLDLLQRLELDLLGAGKRASAIAPPEGVPQADKIEQLLERIAADRERAMREIDGRVIDVEPSTGRRRLSKLDRFLIGADPEDDEAAADDR